ncbi:MAG: PDZ domain-containing protein, partial [Sphingomonadales bacterium]|nr:PDZ domain-containing protein [Sphingomonadales bacterium]
SLGLDRPGGVLLSDVAVGSPAEEAGLMAGDVVLSLDGNEVVDPQGMNYRVATTEMGEDVPVMVFRAGEYLSLDVAMMPLPENPTRNITKLSGRNPFQGVSVANLSPRYADELGLSTDATGVIVIEMDRRSPAARRQFILPGDVILGLNGKPVTLVDDLLGLLAEPQADYVYNLKRQGRVLECGLIGGRSFYCR